MIEVTWLPRDTHFCSRFLMSSFQEVSPRKVVSVSSSGSGSTPLSDIPDHTPQTIAMGKFRTYGQNPDLFRTTFGGFPNLKALDIKYSF